MLFSKERWPGRGQRASLVLGAIVVFTLLAAVAVIFLQRSNYSLSIAKSNQDLSISKELMKSTSLSAESFLKTAVEGVQLDGRLSFSGGPTTENFAALTNRYVGSEVDSAESATLAMEFLEHAIEAQSFSSGGSQDESHPLANFASAFPSAFTDPDESDDEFIQVRYVIEAEPTDVNASLAILTFNYNFRIDVKAYGPIAFTETESSLSGRFEIRLQGAPFSKWATIVNELRNQNGQTLVFAGGDTSAQIQSVYDGPVHVNGVANFYGHPVFNDEFTSGVAESSWRQYTARDYSCCAVFNGPKRGNAETITFPNEMFNTLRLAAGDGSATAATDTSPMTEAEVAALVEHHALGSLPSSPTTVPDGIYIATGSSGSSTATGGVYVEGDANIKLNVVQGADDMNANQFANLDVAHQSCKFQKVSIDPAASGHQTTELLIGSDCDVTYVFNPANYAAAPVKLNNRINGNIYVNGAINELGGESRTRPAIAQDFGFHITAVKDVRIKNDIQYEDVSYVQMNADGTKGDVVVATPSGEAGGSGISPTDRNIAAQIAPESATVLGISSLKRNVKIHIDAPSNLNLHAAIFAGNDQAYNSSTGHGCNANHSSTKGCGFGVEGWDSKLNAGALKLLGSVAQYRSQTSGRLSNPPTGYESRYVYDSRLRQDIQPPGFPISDDFDAFPRFHSYRVWRLSSAE